MDIVRPMAAFTGDIDPLAFYSNVGSRLDVTKISVYVTMTLVSDGLIVSLLPLPCSLLCSFVFLYSFIAPLPCGTFVTLLHLFPSYYSWPISVSPYEFYNSCTAIQWACSAGTSAWYIVSVHEAKAGDNALRAVVTFRSTLFFAFTLVLNVVCSREHQP